MIAVDLALPIALHLLLAQLLAVHSFALCLLLLKLKPCLRLGALLGLPLDLLRPHRRQRFPAERRLREARDPLTVFD